jgi:putative membrane protein
MDFLPIGLANFLVYLVSALVAEGLFLLLYVKVTPHKEFTLIRNGNVAAAISLGGAVLGFTLPIASTVMNSVTLQDMIVWSAIALIAQLAVFLLLSLAFRDLSQRIAADDRAAGIALAVGSLTIGVLNAACLTY